MRVVTEPCSGDPCSICGYEMRWFEKHVLVVHAGGLVDNQYSVTNSLEAFQQSYDAGHRVFEGDLCFTSDGVLVLEHDWEHYYVRQMGVEYDGSAPTYEEYMSSKLHGCYTAMDLDMLIAFMLSHKDAYFMTDFKDCENKELTVSAFRQIVDAAERAGHTEVLDRFIIQIYHFDFKEWVEEVFRFKDYLYTCYLTPPTEQMPAEVTAFCKQNGIPVVTMWTFRMTKNWIDIANQNDIRIYLHTENDLSRAERRLAAGAAGIYTDSICPGDLGK